jgi:hypothetical protein
LFAGSECEGKSGSIPSEPEPAAADSKLASAATAATVSSQQQE